MNIKTLTPDQKKVLSYIIHQQKTAGSPPTVREISAYLGCSSPNSANQHLKLIEQKGYLRRIPGRSRGIEVVIGLEEPVETVESRSIPLIGRVAAGMPITAEENIEGYISIDKTMFGNDSLFTLRVRGDSMIGAGILDGDIVIVRQQPTVDNNEIAVVIIDGEATLKRFIRHNDHIILRAENPAYGDIIVFSDQDVWVVGKLSGVLRKC